ncbi:MAG: TetR/AcrR family transcriptional regulator [Alphaproteobacteria bacterium]|nr:TetR/AcrR family transcriptional regulator [Alphaproteobacteria bacterium]
MIRKKQKQSKTHTQQRVYQAALDLIATEGWTTFSLESVARRLKIPVARVSAFFPDVYAVAQALSDDLNKRVQHSAASIGELSLREGVFELLITRFELMQQNRLVFLALITGAKADRKLAWQGVNAAHVAMRQILTLCGHDAQKSRDRLLVFGLMALYARGLCAWQQDASKDLSRTMAVIDRLMARAETFSSLISPACNPLK